MHLLQRHILEIDCSSQIFAKEVQNVVGELIEKEFYPKLEILLNQYSIKNYNWKIDSLVLNLPNLTEKNWKIDFVNQSIIQIEDFLKSNYKSIDEVEGLIHSKEIYISYKKQAEFLFLEYLVKGIIVENAVYNDLDGLESSIEIDDDFVCKIINQFIESPVSLIRYILNSSIDFKARLENKVKGFSLELEYQVKEVLVGIDYFSKEELKLWIELIQWIIYFVNNKKDTKEAWSNKFKKFSFQYWGLNQERLIEVNNLIAFQIQKDKNSPLVDFFELLNTMITDDKIVSNEFLNQEKKLVVDEFINKKLDRENEQLEEDKKIIFKTKEEAIYIENAGLIILHPFLKLLFEQLNLCEDAVWMGKEEQHRAILLTQYLITGKEKIFENELILNKFLCGLPINSVVNTNLKFTELELEKCNGLLLAVIEHWNILKNTSVDGLRETFLQRAGKLEIKSEQKTELWVEQKGVDVLLSYLPWGTGMIKTPWMDDYLQCNWN